MDSIIEHVIQRLRREIESTTSSYERVVFLNCFNLTRDYTWIDDMHPGKEGFRALAREYYGVLDAT